MQELIGVLMIFSAIIFGIGFLTGSASLSIKEILVITIPLWLFIVIISVGVYLIF